MWQVELAQKLSSGRQKIHFLSMSDQEYREALKFLPPPELRLTMPDPRATSVPSVRSLEEPTIPFPSWPHASFDCAAYWLLYMQEHGSEWDELIENLSCHY